MGANCPEPSEGSRRRDASNRPGNAAKSVAVYSITGGDKASVEVADLSCALVQASQAVGPIRVLLFGRGSREAEPALRSALAGADVQIESRGLLKPKEVSETLYRADVLLFVRGQISTRRGSAIAGIVSGLPVVCYSGPESCWPITEAGILAVPLRDREALAAALVNVLTDEKFREALAERSRQATLRYFSWTAIGAEYASALDGYPAPQKISAYVSSL